ncbi:hypothetical protein AAG906_018542 [Vitis piasezkii]
MSNNDGLAKPIHSRWWLLSLQLLPSPHHSCTRRHQENSTSYLCNFVTYCSLIFITTSRCQEQDFGSDLPSKLLVGLTSLFTSKLATLVTFCAGHKELRAALPVCAVTRLPATFFAIA